MPENDGWKDTAIISTRTATEDSWVQGHHLKSQGATCLDKNHIQNVLLNLQVSAYLVNVCQTL